MTRGRRWTTYSLSTLALLGVIAFAVIRQSSGSTGSALSYCEGYRVGDPQATTETFWRRTWCEPGNAFAFAVAVFTAALTAVTLGLLLTGNRQIRLARDEFTAEHRPWLKVEVTHTGPLTWGADGQGNIEIAMSITNVGRGIARHVENSAEVHFQTDQVERAPAHQHMISEAARKRDISPTTSTAGVTIFPQDTPVVQIRSLMISPDDARRGLAHTKVSLMPTIVGCVSYRDALGNSRDHQTGFIYRVRHIDTTKPHGAFLPILPGQTVGWSALRLDVDPFSSGITD